MSVAQAIGREIDPYGGWYCEPHQDKLWNYLQAGGLRAAVVWHRRAGKDDISLRWTCRCMCRRVGNYWHMLPQAEQARKAIWEAINPHTGKRRIDEAFPLELRKRTRNNEMMIEFKNGSIWQVVGSDNFNALVGSPPIGIVFSEFSLADPAAWAYLRPILRENGGWAVFIYTPRGRNHGLQLYQSAKRAEGWFHEVLDATQTAVFSGAELEEERKELIAQFGLEIGDAFFQQEYMCSFDAAVIGAVYANGLNALEKSGRIVPTPWDPNYPVQTAWDLGWSDATAIWWFQIVPGPRINIIDHYRSSGHKPQHYIERLYGQEIVFDQNGKVWLGDPLPKDQGGREHAHRMAYEYSNHWIPHDGGHKTLAAGGRSFGDQAFDMGVSMDVLPQTSVLNGIAAARRTLEFCAFDMERCEAGLDAMRSYHFNWDAKTKILSDEPVHDWSSHDAKAFEIIGQVWQPRLQDKPPEKARFLNEATADEVFWPKHGGGNKWNSRSDRI